MSINSAAPSLPEGRIIPYTKFAQKAKKLGAINSLTRENITHAYNKDGIIVSSYHRSQILETGVEVMPQTQIKIHE